ncbi:recombinase family protein [Candidatus Uabimicrobium amorphum]|uniref:Recombinase RecB n=1 Tax=Uabimicrobium amorphum TaxID=2596890 RepID=A0A5S9IPS4_UABAM|nr:recombinase family protein [Candidatus Uabimicrobium amorphum]BBM85853.1 recombinase RecB [Candidatus Uabimicrobium amorphum]
MGKNKRYYAIYARISCKKDCSIQTQRELLADYIKNDNGRLCQYLVYEDDGVSGKNTVRKEFQNLLRDIREGKIHTIVSTEVSRISRNVVDFQNFLSLCQKYNTIFKSLDGNVSSENEQEKLMMSLQSLFAQVEIEQISKRVTRSFDHKSLKGMFTGGKIFGYRSGIEGKGKLYVDKEEAELVAMIFDMYIEKKSYCHIACWLNDNGYHTREYISSYGVFHPGKKWSKSKVLSILKNPAYIGKKNVKGILVSASWEAIIDSNVWNTVQVIIRAKVNKQKKDSYKYLLGGLIYCQHCETYLESGSGTGSKGKTYYYYRHSGCMHKIGCPYRRNISAKEIENKIFCEILLFLDRENLLSVLLEDVMIKVFNERELRKTTQKFWSRKISSYNEMHKLLLRIIRVVISKSNDFVQECSDVEIFVKDLLDMEKKAQNFLKIIVKKVKLEGKRGAIMLL